MKGKIIVIDGMDGCGKHTQAKILYDTLKKRKYKVELFSFPNYEDDSSYFVKKLLNKEYDDINNPYLVSLFYSIDRGITYIRDIKEKYENGYTIILDRYYISNILYQLQNIISHANRFNYIHFLKTVEVEGLGLPKPDITIILASKPEISNKLLNKRYNNDDSKKDIYENIEVQNKVYEVISFIDKYRQLISMKDAIGLVKILYIHDDKGNIYTKEQMADKIISLV